MSFKLTAPETQDVETLDALLDLVDTFCHETMEVVEGTGLESITEMEAEGEGLVNDLMEIGEDDIGILPALRLIDFVLRTEFEMAASVEGAQEKMRSFVPQALRSEVNADLIEKYELTGLATLAQRAKGPDPS